MGEKAKVYYSAGFFITVSPDSMLKVAKHASEHVDKRFCVNLSAPFICQFFKDPLNQVLEYADIVSGNGEVSEIPVIKLASDKIVDTNGAGDAFVGGFLAQLAKGNSVNEAIRCGVWAATEIIQVSGCTCDPAKTY